MVQVGLQRSNQVKSGQAKWRSELERRECLDAGPSAVDDLAAVGSTSCKGPQDKMFTCRYPGLTARCWRWWRSGALPADLSLGGTGRLQQFQEDCKSLASQCRCAELVTAHLPLEFYNKHRCQQMYQRMAMMWRHVC